MTRSDWTSGQLFLNITLLGLAALATYFALRHEQLRMVRADVKHNASRFLRGLNDISALFNSSISAIQETELVSRGYNM